MHRTPRRDKGQIRLNSRDITVLTWIGEQYAVRLDTLQRLLGREAQQATKVEGQVSESTARRVLERWKQERLVSSRKWFYGEPEWVWLTAHGLRQMELPFKAGQPSVALLSHVHLVNLLRLYTEATYKEFKQWRGERLLRQLHRGDSGFHIPDGEVVTDTGVIAIEVERTLKSRPRVEQIVQTLSHHYQRVWFFVTPETRPLVTEATARQRDRFTLYDLEKLVARYR